MDKQTFFITHEDFRPDGSMPGELRSYKREAATLAEALAQRVEDSEIEHPLPDGLKEMYRISIWV